MKDFDYLVDVYRRMTGMLQFHLADMSDAELLTRPAPSANHIAWQLAHLINSTTNIANMATPGALPVLPEEFSKTAGKDGSKLDGGFENKQQLIDRFTKVMDGAAAWAQKLSDADKATPTPDKMHGFAKTVGELAIMLPVHVSMHVGQIQSIRRKLGKPVLF